MSFLSRLKLLSKFALSSLAQSLLYPSRASMDNEKRTDLDNLSPEFISEILRYLVVHPKAKDTVRGIERWWLSQNVSVETKRKLEDSLDFLVAKGWVVERRSAQSPTLYSLNEAALDQIKKFLDEEF